MWGGSAVWNRSGQAQLHLFFLLRFFNPVQQVLRFFQCPRHVVENRAPFRALSAQGCFKQIPYIIQCFRAGSMHGQFFFRKNVLHNAALRLFESPIVHVR